jgi:hypothetical protein
MITVDNHAKLIAAFLGADEPCYGECQCASCRAWPPSGQPMGLSPIAARGKPNRLLRHSLGGSLQR